MAIDKAKLNRLHQQSRALLESLADRIPAGELEELRTYSYVGEWGELMESICANLVVDQIPITTEERDALAAIFAMYPEPSANYRYWRNHDRTFDALNVVE